MNLKEVLRSQAAEWGLRLSDSQLKALLAYAHLLNEYDQARIIGTRGLRGIVLDHVLDSLSCFLVPELTGTEAIVDVGSGGGLPGIPLKLANGDARVTLIESVEKKARFLEYAVERLGLRDVEIVCERAEEHGRKSDARGAYGTAVIRAVASLAVAAEYCMPLVAVGGVVVAMKARVQTEELEAGKRAAALLGGRVVDVVRVPSISELPDKERRLVVIEKENETSEQYPRPVGKPAKRPLGR